MNKWITTFREAEINSIAVSTKAKCESPEDNVSLFQLKNRLQKGDLSQDNNATFNRHYHIFGNPMDSDLVAQKSHQSPWVVTGWIRRAMVPMLGIRQNMQSSMIESSVDDTSPSCELRKLFDSQFVDGHDSTAPRNMSIERHIDLKPEKEISEFCHSSA